MTEINTDGITMDFENDKGERTRKTVERLIIKASPLWVTAMFKYRTKGKLGWSDPTVCIRRYQRIGEGWKVKAKFNFSDKEQCAMVSGILGEWAK